MSLATMTARVNDALRVEATVMIGYRLGREYGLTYQVMTVTEDERRTVRSHGENYARLFRDDSNPRSRQWVVVTRPVDGKSASRHYRSRAAAIDGEALHAATVAADIIRDEYRALARAAFDDMRELDDSVE